MTKSPARPTRYKGAAPGRRQEIVDIAMELFARKGVQATSVREIAEAANILSGSLYSHFGSKTEILDLGIRPYTETSLVELRQIVSSDLPPKEKIRDLLHQSFTRMVEWRAAASVMHSDWEYLSTLDGFEFVRDFFAEVNEIWLEVIHDAVDKGALAGDIEPEVVFRLLTQIMGGIVHRYRPGGRISVDMMIDYFHRMLFGGLSQPSSNNPSVSKPTAINVEFNAGDVT